jgi:MFS family permease
LWRSPAARRRLAVVALTDGEPGILMGACLMNSERTVDRRAGWLGIAFLVLLLASEITLSLPDEHATAAAVTTFYAAHRAIIIGLQIAGLVASALLALFAWRLRVISPGVAGAGLLLAATTLAPTLITLAVAITADPAHPTTAGTLNHWEPRGDDLLFVGVLLFAATLLPFLGRPPRWLGVLAGIVAVFCLLRFALELLGQPRGALDAIAPISFLVLVGALTWLSFRGLPSAATEAGGSDVRPLRPA